MKRNTFLVALGVAALTATVVAQRGPREPGRFIRMMPITAALDSNQDGEISMAEMPPG